MGYDGDGKMVNSIASFSSFGRNEFRWEIGMRNRLDRSNTGDYVLFVMYVLCHKLLGQLTLSSDSVHPHAPIYGTNLTN